MFREIEARPSPGILMAVLIGVVVLIGGTLVCLVPSKVARTYTRTEVVGVAKENAPVEV